MDNVDGFRKELLMEMPPLLHFRTVPFPNNGPSAVERREKLLSQFPTNTLHNINNNINNNNNNNNNNNKYNDKYNKDMNMNINTIPLSIPSTLQRYAQHPQTSGKTATTQTDHTLLLSLLLSPDVMETTTTTEEEEEREGIINRRRKRRISSNLLNALKSISNSSIATQTTEKEKKITRATSTSPMKCIETAINTEFTVDDWYKQETLCQQQSNRIERLERERVGMEITIASAQQYIHQYKQQQQHFFLQQQEKIYTNIKEELIQETERRERALWIQEENETRSLLHTLWRTWQWTNSHIREAKREEEEILQQAHYIWKQEQTQHIWNLIKAETTHRDTLQALEQQSIDLLQETFTFAENCRRAASQTAAIAIASQRETENQLKEALQREKELRLQYLHVLRLPTTTIVNRHSLHGRSEEEKEREEEEREREMPVHVRFARAHREALNTVSTQRIQLSTQTRVL
ncbi:uncharacterized protein TM35_000361610 [Trypanosoma theileri]|uniref:Uncharacterized protein n=1 Tax=Trypanosoma theileri TaxID=67003 RepID=A0A1X0NL48_9TRYP|nr:uncharacterized protein TM35_000361610 [Trypanosoma theileri]ORC85301.1 hypothetical protein TM35_000361610 [Trypanosoma theileri]